MPAKPVFRPKPHAVEALFNRRKAVISVIHSLPLPGSPGHDGQPMAEIVDFAVAEALCYRDGGLDGLIVENHGDIPFSKPEHLGPETAACMAVMTDAVRRAAGLTVGVNVLANGAEQAIAVAVAAGARFVRVNQWANAYVANEGFVEGPAALATRYRARLHGRSIKVFADVQVKHGAHAITADRSIPELARGFCQVSGPGVRGLARRFCQVSRQSCCCRPLTLPAYPAARMVSTLVARRRCNMRRRLAETRWLWRARGRRWLRSSSWLRQKRSAEMKLLNPRIHRSRPLMPR